MPRHNKNSPAGRLATILIVVLIAAAGLVYGLRYQSSITTSTGLFASITVVDNSGNSQSFKGTAIPAYSSIQVSFNGNQPVTLYDNTKPTSIGSVQVVPVAQITVQNGTPQSWGVTGSCQMLLGTTVLSTSTLNQNGNGAPPATLSLQGVQENGNDLWQKLGGVAVGSQTSQPISTYCNGQMSVAFSDGNTETQSFGGNIASATVSGTSNNAFSVNVQSQPLTSAAGACVNQSCQPPPPTYYTLIAGILCQDGSVNCGAVSPTGQNSYVSGTSVTLTATPTNNYVFLGWCVSSTAVSASACNTVTDSSSQLSYSINSNTVVNGIFAFNVVTHTQTSSTESSSSTTSTTGTTSTSSTTGTTSTTSTSSSTSPTTSSTTTPPPPTSTTQHQSTSTSVSFTGQCRTGSNGGSSGGTAPSGGGTASSGGGGSVVAGTMVLMADGSLKPIEQIKVGDNILGYDYGNIRIGTYGATFGSESSQVTQIRNVGTTETYTFNNGLITSDGIQPFYTQRGWVQANNVVVGDKFYSPASKIWVPVTSIVASPNATTVYDMKMTAPFISYSANGILVNDLKFLGLVSIPLFTFSIVC